MSHITEQYFHELLRQGDYDAASRAYFHWGKVMADCPSGPMTRQEEEAGARQDAAQDAMRALEAMKHKRPFRGDHVNWTYNP